MPAARTAEQLTRDRELLLDAAESLFYANGIQAVGMDRIREDCGLSLKRIYAMFPAKEDLVVAMLRRRDQRWRTSLAAYVEAVGDPYGRLLAIFDWLGDWFGEPGFRGCAWINIHGELGPGSGPVLDEVRGHKQALHDQISAWAGTEYAADVDAVYLLVEGAIVTAGITGDPGSARSAKAAAERLLEGGRIRRGH